MSKERTLDDFINDSSNLIGQEAADVSAGNVETDYWALRRFVGSLGDGNPLYSDPVYALVTKYQTLTAPPTFLAAIRRPEARGAFTTADYGLASLLSRVEFEMVDVIRLGDPPRSELKLTGVGEGKRTTTKGVKRAVDLTCEGTYWNFYGGLLGKARGTVTFIPYERGKEFLLDRGVYRYSDEEVAKIKKDLESESPPRGRKPLYWGEDVNVGDKLPQLVKGPVSLDDMENWFGASLGLRSLGWGQDVYHELKDKPGLKITNPTTNWPYWDYDQTWEDIQSCEAGGFHAPYCRGLMTVCLAGHLLTNWMSDDAFLRRLSVELAVPNLLLYGDTMWLRGEVTDKYKEKICGTVYRAVDVKVSGVNQLGEKLVEGTATAYLPDRGHVVRLPIPVSK